MELEVNISNEDILEVEAIKEIKSKTISTCGLDGSYIIPTILQKECQHIPWAKWRGYYPDHMSSQFWSPL